ncbi:hypothetical protein [Microbacterium sp. NPDC080220]|uniref:hypothetical protein n=1 Tax=Microbacterium sp. NPDC080220 TaxID=3161017 RepID=UPI003418C439
MTPREVNVLLTNAALLDARLRREPEERAQMATAWAQILADVSLEVGMAALQQHYREETRPIMPADIAALADAVTPDRVRLADGSDWLTRHGVNPAEFQSRIDAGERPARVLRELGVSGDV